MSIRAFGLELRRLGDSSRLFEDVDRVLAAHGITREAVGVPMQVNTVAHALHKMMKSDSNFYSSTINECASIAGIVISSERQAIYRAAHCMSWSEMTPEYRQALCAMVLDDFRPVLTAEL